MHLQTFNRFLYHWECEKCQNIVKTQRSRNSLKTSKKDRIYSDLILNSFTGYFKYEYVNVVSVSDVTKWKRKKRTPSPGNPRQTNDTVFPWRVLSAARALSDWLEHGRPAGPKRTGKTTAVTGQGRNCPSLPSPARNRGRHPWGGGIITRTRMVSCCITVTVYRVHGISGGPDIPDRRFPSSPETRIDTA